MCAIMSRSHHARAPTHEEIDKHAKLTMNLFMFELAREVDWCKPLI